MLENLAGNFQCDDRLLAELRRCRIPQELVDRTESEVPYSWIGQFGDFRFTRSWTYWVVEGPVPIEVAEGLYADPVGKKDIRVAGHAGRPSPKDWTVWLTSDGKEVLPVKKERESKAIALKHPKFPIEKMTFSDDPGSIGAKQYVTTYHIDTEIGLRVFADTLRAHSLVPEDELVPT